jgi:hypothetical protein
VITAILPSNMGTREVTTMGSSRALHRQAPSAEGNLDVQSPQQGQPDAPTGRRDPQRFVTGTAPTIASTYQRESDFR